MRSERFSGANSHIAFRILHHCAQRICLVMVSCIHHAVENAFCFRSRTNALFASGYGETALSKATTSHPVTWFEQSSYIGAPLRLSEGPLPVLYPSEPPPVPLVLGPKAALRAAFLLPCDLDDVPPTVKPREDRSRHRSRSQDAREGSTRISKERWEVSRAFKDTRWSCS